MRLCRVCGSTTNEFKIHSGNSRKGICKPCHNEYMKEYNLADKMSVCRENNSLKSKLKLAEEEIERLKNKTEGVK